MFCNFNKVKYLFVIAEKRTMSESYRISLVWIYSAKWLSEIARDSNFVWLTASSSQANSEDLQARFVQETTRVKRPRDNLEWRVSMKSHHPWAP